MSGEAIGVLLRSASDTRKRLLPTVVSCETRIGTTFCAACGQPDGAAPSTRPQAVSSTGADADAGVDAAGPGPEQAAATSRETRRRAPRETAAGRDCIAGITI